MLVFIFLGEFLLSLLLFFSTNFLLFGSLLILCLDIFFVFYMVVDAHVDVVLPKQHILTADRDIERDCFHVLETIRVVLIFIG